jgi:hypothetical protein
VLEAGISWNHPTFLDLFLPAVAAVIVVRFIRDGGSKMLAMMSGSPRQREGNRAA